MATTALPWHIGPMSSYLLEQIWSGGSLCLKSPLANMECLADMPGNALMPATFF